MSSARAALFSLGAILAAGAPLAVGACGTDAVGTLALPDASFVDVRPTDGQRTVDSSTGDDAASPTDAAPDVYDASIDVALDAPDASDASTGACRDGVVDPGEQCDDGNDVDIDACSNTCVKNTIYVGGDAKTYVANALAILGENGWIAADGSYGDAPAAGVLVSTNAGGNGVFPTGWQTYLDAGGHILVLGGDNTDAYRAFIGGFVSVDATTAWHESDDCTSDWNRSVVGPLTELLPATYEFANQATSYHMLHFTASQPASTTILGTTCHTGATGANGVFVTRTYASGGSFSYFAFDVGEYTGAGTPDELVKPLLDGWLRYVRAKK